MQKSDTIVLLHGLMGNRLDMWPIARRLRGRGLEVHNLRYRSVGNRIETHARWLGEELCRINSEGPFQLVTFSMGGVIARSTLAANRFPNLSRVLMLAPPHHGSHAARRLAPWLSWITPSLSQLSDDPGSFVNRLPNSFAESGVEFAIVEASRDRVIKPGTVWLEGVRQKAHVDGHHGVLTWYRRTIDLVENYIVSGSFERLSRTQSASAV